MPRYQSQKTIHALKIKALQPHPEHPGEYLLTPEDTTYCPFMVSRDYVNNRGAKEGGYYVVYQNGYESWSSAVAFEGGYTLIKYRNCPEGVHMEHINQNPDCTCGFCQIFKLKVRVAELEAEIRSFADAT